MNLKFENRERNLLTVKQKSFQRLDYIHIKAPDMNFHSSVENLICQLLRVVKQ